MRTDRLLVHLRFKGGARESLDLPLPQTAWRRRLTQPGVVTRIAELLERFDEAQVAALLNAEGLRTGAGKEFDADAVRWVRYNHGLQSPAERLHQIGRLTTRETAARLGIPESLAREWAQKGRLNATRLGRKPVWMIDPLEDQPDPVRRRAADRATLPMRRGHLSDAAVGKGAV